ncbi:hypothetical protein [Ferrovibrio sp.]|uniref:hypothetical protein n=1 Tax=Ferrovibrio sp. TaxID=1917215 RepID=UPI00311D4C93
MNRIASLIALLLLAGCAGTTLDSSVDQELWVGKSRVDLVAAKGPPDSEQSILFGGSVLIFVSDDHRLTAIFPKGPTRHKCMTRFKVDEGGTIVDVSKSGNCHS